MEALTSRSHSPGETPGFQLLALGRWPWELWPVSWEEWRQRLGLVSNQGCFWEPAFKKLYLLELETPGVRLGHTWLQVSPAAMLIAGVQAGACLVREYPSVFLPFW